MSHLRDAMKENMGEEAEESKGDSEQEKIGSCNEIKSNSSTQC